LERGDSGSKKAEEVMRLLPGETFQYSFDGVPDRKILVGSYGVSAWVVMDLTIGNDSTRQRVGFHSDYKNPNHVTIDHDYPSTPQEREQWEAQHRASMSHQPVKSGETFAEDGLYRAVRLIPGASYRSLQVKPFKAGDIATTENVRMPMESANGVEINGPVQWVWEGSAPTRTKPFSSDYIEGTEHVCTPGATCPRSGRWVARVRTGSEYLSPVYQYDLSHIIALRAGQQMPQIQGDAGKTEWEWVGA
jgi:hypothetical protein